MHEVLPAQITKTHKNTETQKHRRATLFIAQVSLGNSKPVDGEIQIYFFSSLAKKLEDV